MTSAAGGTPLPCPFCGHEGVSMYEGSTFRWRYIACDECGASPGETRIQTLGEGSREEWEAEVLREAIERWNTRASRQPFREGLEAAIVAVEAEPEFPGAMPDSMFAAMVSDKDACEEAMRIAVRHTKRDIIARIKALPSPPNGSGEQG
jgi:hypothetical protein